jgi:hypothetical protein
LLGGVPLLPNPHLKIGEVMKVRFLRSGKQAHEEPGLAQFKFQEGETMSGLSEATATSMKESGNAEILGEDDIEEVEEVEEEKIEDDEEEQPKSKMPWSK